MTRLFPVPVIRFCDVKCHYLLLHIANIDTCGVPEHLEGDGYVTSPGYPEEYGNNECESWLLSVTPGNVRLTVVCNSSLGMGQLFPNLL